MWSEDMDKHIRDAAGNVRHGFEENSWEKMLPLLDEHLPQEKKRRRFIIFWFTGLGIAIGMAGILFVRQHSFTNDKKVTEQSIAVPVEKKQIQTGTSRPSATNQEPAKETAITNHKQAKTISTKNLPYETLSNTGDIENVLNKEKNKQPYPVNKKTLSSAKREMKPAGQPAVSSTIEKDNSRQEKKKDISPDQQVIAATTSISEHNKEKEDQQDKLPGKEPMLTENKPAIKNEASDPVLKTSIEDSLAGIPEQPEKKETKTLPGSSKFSINISFGPDLSAVGAQPGNWQMQYGIGIGYAVSRHITLRTGFYVGRKVYAADSTSYKTPYNNLYNYYFLQRIDANCLVYEIPVTVAYNVIQSPTNSLFISTGLSSYLMKKEDYEYYYKAPSGNRQTHSYSYSRNSHLFSVINLSAGYQYHFSNRLSVIAEPYIKVPVTGIGNGRVNLNSGGVLFTVGFKPF